jgi:hypothetical protein
MKTTLNKKQSWYNPMYLNGEKEIENLYFFDHNTGKKFEERGLKWFSHSEKNTNNNSFNTIEFSFETTKSLNKEKSLLKKKAFFIPTESKNYSKEKKYDVYFPVELLNFKPQQEKFTASIDDNEIHKQTRYWIEEKCTTVDNNAQPLYRKLYWFSFYEITKTKQGKEMQNIIDIFSEAGIRISTYELEKLKEKINITIK